MCTIICHEDVVQRGLGVCSMSMGVQYKHVLHGGKEGKGTRNQGQRTCKIKAIIE